MTWVRDALWTLKCNFNSPYTLGHTWHSPYIISCFITTTIWITKGWFFNHGRCATLYLKASARAISIARSLNICLRVIFSYIFSCTSSSWWKIHYMVWCAKGLWCWCSWINHVSFWAHGRCCANECGCLNHFLVCLCLFF